MQNPSLVIEKISAPMLGRRGKQAIWPWAKMAVGSSFLVPGTAKLSAEQLRKHRVRNSAAQWKRLHPGFNYTIQKTPKGLRCYRIAADTTTT
jgi:hypothetical protein